MTYAMLTAEDDCETGHLVEWLTAHGFQCEPDAYPIYCRLGPWPCAPLVFLQPETADDARLLAAHQQDSKHGLLQVFLDHRWPEGWMTTFPPDPFDPTDGGVPAPRRV